MPVNLKPSTLLQVTLQLHWSTILFIIISDLISHHANEMGDTPMLLVVRVHGQPSQCQIEGCFSSK